MICANPRRVYQQAARFARVSVLTGFLAVVPFAGTAMADSITLSTAQSLIGGTLNQGFYQAPNGLHSPLNTQITTSSTQRSFFIFDLSLIGDSIIDSATLSIFNPSLTGAVGFFDVLNSPIIVKTTTDSNPALPNPGIAIYDDLGTGVQFGGGPANVSDVTRLSYVTFALNSLAIERLNAANSYFGIGAKLTSQFGTAFSATGTPPAAFLDLQTHSPNPPTTVPDSSATFALFGLAGAALAVLRRHL